MKLDKIRDVEDVQVIVEDAMQMQEPHLNEDSIAGLALLLRYNLLLDLEKMLNSGRTLQSIQFLKSNLDHLGSEYPIEGDVLLENFLQKLLIHDGEKDANLIPTHPFASGVSCIIQRYSETMGS